jgi:hypothetical protein
MMLVSRNSDPTGDTSRTATAYPSEGQASVPSFGFSSCCSIFSFPWSRCIVCPSYYPFGIFTLFFLKICQRRNVSCCCILTIDRDAVLCVGVWMRAFLTNLINKSNLSSTIIEIYVSKTSNIHIIFRNLIYIFFISVQLQ